MRIYSGLLGLAFVCLASGAATAACGSDKLGTSRTLTLDASKHRYFEGGERSLGLRHKEVILTFDDGPLAGTTPRILKVLKKECVKATFFYVGRMAKFHPKLVKRVIAAGHTLGHHTHAHSRLTGYSTKRGSQFIDKGIRTIQKIAYGIDSSKARVPFFRYPYLAKSKSTNQMVARKGLIAFDANIDSLDWKKSSADAVHNRIMHRLRKEGKGIILMHDIQQRTAKMLPRLLRTLKDEGYRVVHMVPKGTAVPTDNLVVASVSTNQEKKKPQESQIVALDEAPGDVSIPLPDYEKVADQTVSEQQTAKLSPAEDGNPVRTGVEVVTVAKPTPEPVARHQEDQLKPRKKVKKRTKARRIRKKLKNTTRQRKRSSSIIVLASRKKKNRIGTAKGWKLRRSQWILR